MQCRSSIALAAAALSVVTMVAAGRSFADEPPLDAKSAFERNVATVFVRNCLSCHNASEASGGLDLSQAASVLKGGDSGAAIAPGDPDGSYLLERIKEGSMPPKGKGRPLTEEVTSLLSNWIKSGAVWPEGRTLNPFEFTTEHRAGLDWWSLKPPTRPAVPPVTPAHTAWVRNEIDAFVAARLDAAQLVPSPEADRATLIRRAMLDLLGLPPTPEEIDAFVADPAPDAYERLVDRLLDSPHYGERWGRHWLDVVRFGETNGYETNTPRPNAWPYRDYVIDSLNADKPFDQFVREQLAGDQLGIDVATAFLVGGTHDTVGNQTVEGMLQQRVDDLNDIVMTTSEAFLGLTVGCAKCHDHKFDAISQRDYYALKAVFAGVFHGERQIHSPDYEERLRNEPDVRRQLAEVDRALEQLELLAVVGLANDGSQRRAAVNPRHNVDRFAPIAARFVRFSIESTNSSEPCLDELEVFTTGEQPVNVALASLGAKVSASDVYANGTSAIHQVAHANDGQYGNSRSWISGTLGGGWVQIELAEPAEIDRIVWARDREGQFADRLATKYRLEVALEPDQWQTVATSHDRRPFDGTEANATATLDAYPAESKEAARELIARRSELISRLPESAARPVYAGEFREAEVVHLLRRGDPMQPGDEVAPGGIASLGVAWQLSPAAKEADRRRALAEWIVSPANPLSSRVLVNRIWQHHFGTGLTSTPNDFGFHGEQPSHPELLDWLATELVAREWRMKPLHRRIMLSAAYRQASRPREDALAVDAASRLLWRFPPRRLEAEPIRDRVLWTSGKLDLRRGGPGYDPFVPNTNYVHVFEPKTKFGPDDWRRMVYQTKPRMEQDQTFGVFDCPDAAASLPRRNSSTTAMQALSLLNSPFLIEQAGYFAERVRGEVGHEITAQARQAFRLAFGREPTEEERTGATQLIETHGLPALCRALFNANEFVQMN